MHAPVSVFTEVHLYLYVYVSKYICMLHSLDFLNVAVVLGPISGAAGEIFFERKFAFEQMISRELNNFW